MKKITTLTLAIGLAISANAAEVETTNITSFTSGTAAKASEVNSTISALITAIDDNAATISTLQTTISEMQTTITELEASISVDVTGYSYRIVNIGTGTLVDTDTAWGAAYHQGSKALLTFNDNGSLDMSDFSIEEIEIDLDNECEQDSETGEWDCSRAVQTYSDGGSLTGSWSQSGNTVTATIDGETMSWVVSDSGNTLISEDLIWIDTQEDPSFYEASMLIGVKASE